MIQNSVNLDLSYKTFPNYLRIFQQLYTFYTFCHVQYGELKEIYYSKHETKTSGSNAEGVANIEW